MRRLLFFVLALGINMPALHAKEWTHPKLKSKEKIIRTVAIVPPRVVINKAGVKGSQSMLQESEQVGAEITRIISQDLTQRGFTVRSDQFSAASLNGNEGLKYSMADLQNRYDQLAEQLLRKPKDVTKGRFSLGDQVSTFGSTAAVDALVFVRSSGTMLTGRKKAFGLLVGGAKNHSVVSTISIVDAQTGEVLFVSVLGAVGNFVEHPDKTFEKPISNAFKKFVNAK